MLHCFLNMETILKVFLIDYRAEFVWHWLCKDRVFAFAIDTRTSRTLQNDRNLIADAAAMNLRTGCGQTSQECT